MKRKNLFYALSIAVAAVAMTACSSENDVTTVPDINNPAEASGTWQVTINAGPAETRAISVGGNSGNALFTNWNTGDVVEVVKGSSVVGTLTATASTGNSAYAVLEGTLTGTFAEGDVLTLCYHSATFDYTKQKGTLADVSTNTSYLTATSTVTAINVGSSDINSSGSGKLIMSDASFTAQQAYVDITFTDDLGNPYDITKLEVYTSGGKLVTTKGIASGASSYATESYPLTITPSPATNHFFLALRDDNGKSNTYYFKATTAYGDLTYSQSLKLENGNYYKASSPKVLYVAPIVTNLTSGTKFEHYGYYRIGTSDDDPDNTAMTLSVSGTSKGYYIDLANPATVTLTNIDATLRNHEFLSGVNNSAAYVYNINGTNRIYTKGDYAIYADYNSSTIKLMGSGTLTVTSSKPEYCGILASNYKSSNTSSVDNNYSTINTEVSVSEQLAATGYTVKRSARIDNADGTYTWKYIVTAK
jgi:hypothetical protein